MALLRLSATLAICADRLLINWGRSNLKRYVSQAETIWFLPEGLRQ